MPQKANKIHFPDVYRIPFYFWQEPKVVITSKTTPEDKSKSKKPFKDVISLPSYLWPNPRGRPTKKSQVKYPVYRLIPQTVNTDSESFSEMDSNEESKIIKTETFDTDSNPLNSNNLFNLDFGTILDSLNMDINNIPYPGQENSRVNITEIFASQSIPDNTIKMEIDTQNINQTSETDNLEFPQPPSQEDLDASMVDETETHSTVSTWSEVVDNNSETDVYTHLVIPYFKCKEPEKISEAIDNLKEWYKNETIRLKQRDTDIKSDDLMSFSEDISEYFEHEINKRKKMFFKWKQLLSVRRRNLLDENTNVKIINNSSLESEVKESTKKTDENSDQKILDANTKFKEFEKLFLKNLKGKKVPQIIKKPTDKFNEKSTEKKNFNSD